MCRLSPSLSYETGVNSDTQRCKHRCRHTEPQTLLQRLMDTCHSMDKATSQCPAGPHGQPNHMNVCTQTYRCRHGEWSAGTRAPEEPQIEKKNTERQGKPWIPRGKWVPLMPRPRALTACPSQDAQIPAAPALLRMPRSLLHCAPPGRTRLRGLRVCPTHCLPRTGDCGAGC